MKTLLEIFEDAKKLDNMGEGRLLICMNAEPFAIFNAKILDPYMGALLTNDDKVVSFTDVQAMNCQADWAD